MANFKLVLSLLVVTLTFARAAELPFNVRDPGMHFLRTLDRDAQHCLLSPRPYASLAPGEPSPPPMEKMIEKKDQVIALMRADQDDDAFELSHELVADLKWSISKTEDLVPIYLMIAVRYDRFALLKVLNRSVEALLELIEICQLVDYERVGDLQKVEKLYLSEIDKLAASSPHRILQVSSDASEQEIRGSLNRLRDILELENAHLFPVYKRQYGQLVEMVEHAFNVRLGFKL